MMKKILYFMLATILICGCKQEAPLTFQAGTYEVTAQGHNGDIRPPSLLKPPQAG